MGNYTRIAKLNDVPPGEVIGVSFGDERVCVANVDGTIYAFSGMCHHMGGPLEEGFLEGNSLQCPWHAGDYDVRTGEALNPPASGQLEVYATRVNGDDVEIDRVP